MADVVAAPVDSISQGTPVLYDTPAWGEAEDDGPQI
jgi:hypothetical protein